MQESERKRVRKIIEARAGEGGRAGEIGRERNEAITEMFALSTSTGYEGSEKDSPREKRGERREEER
eukprot:1318781-Amorphochlora_amoeboformis.AAC.2